MRIGQLTVTRTGKPLALALQRTEASAPQDRIALLLSRAVEVVRKARKHKKSLVGNNFYANTLAELRADASNALHELTNGVVDSPGLARLVEACFSPSLEPAQRIEAKRALLHELKTTWNKRSSTNLENADRELFPLSMLVETKRSYLVSIGRQINGCYSVERCGPYVCPWPIFSRT
jgi:hypothetical protein